MEKFWKEWKWAILGGVAILILGLVIRLYQLTLLPIFADEAIYIRWAQVMKAEETLRFLPLSDGKQPLFMWLVIPFLKLFSDPLFAGRFVSVASGIGTLIGIFSLAYYLFKSKKVALVAGFTYAISPFSIFFDRMALVDSLLTCFGVWTLFFGALTVKTHRLDFAMITGFLLGGALLTKSTGLFFAILLPSAWIFSTWRKIPKLSLLFFATYLIAAGMYNILRLGPNFHLIASRNQDYVFPLSHLWTNPRDPFIFFIDRSFEWIRMMGPWMVLVLWLISYLVAWTKHKKEVLVLTVWFLVPVLVQSEFAKVFTARYILFSLPYLFILGASVFLVKNENLRKLFVVGLIILIFQAVRFDYFLLTNPERANLPSSERSGYLEEWTAGTGIRQVADFIKEELARNPDQKIVVGTEGFFGTLPDGLQIYLEGAPRVRVIGVGISLNETPQSLKDSVASGNKTYLVINSSRLKIKEVDYQKNGLKLIKSFAKAERREKNTHEYIWYGPRDYLYLFEVKK